MARTNFEQLLEAGVHFGHQTRRWNPKMKPYIFGAQPGRKPVWLFIAQMIQNTKGKRLYYPKGGTTMVTVRQVGEAIAGAERIFQVIDEQPEPADDPQVRLLDTEDASKVSAVADACRLFRIGVSWGGFESLILPQYNGQNAEQLREARIPLGLVRLYIGLENPADLTADLEAALNACC